MSYFKLFRVINLLILALVMYMLRLFLFEPCFAMDNIQSPFSELQFAMMVLAYVFIAAGGYALNDYYDLGMDEINRPNKTILRNKLPMKTGLNCFFIFSAIGIIIGIILAYQMKSTSMYLFPIFVTALYWFYSTKYKREFISGNVAVSFMAAFTIFSVFLYYILSFKKTGNFPILSYKYMLQTTLIYTGFAFFITFIREVVKDILDVKGDKEFDCVNIPIKYGLKKTKNIITIMSAIFMLCLIVFGITSYLSQKKYLFYYIAILLIPMFIYFMVQLSRAKNENDYSSLSTFLKIYMVAGILSVQLLNESLL